MPDDVTLWDLFFAGTQTVCALLGLALAIAQAKPLLRRWFDRRIAPRAPVVENGRLSGEQFAAASPVDTNKAATAPRSPAYRAAIRPELSSATWVLLSVGCALALLAAVLVKTVNIQYRGTVDALFMLQVVGGLTVATGIYIGPRRAVPAVYGLIVILGAIGAASLFWRADGVVVDLQAIGHGFVPLFVVSLALRFRGLPLVQGAIFGGGTLCVAGSPTFIGYILIAAVTLALLSPGRLTWIIWLLPSSLALSFLIYDLRHLVPIVQAWVSADSGAHFDWMWQHDEYLRILTSAAVFGPGDSQWVVLMGTTGWFVGLSMILGLIPAVLVAVAVLLTFGRLTAAAFAIRRDRIQAIVLCAPLLPITVISLAVQVGLLPTFGLLPPPFSSIGSGSIWLALALCAVRWPVLREGDPGPAFVRSMTLLGLAEETTAPA